MSTLTEAQILISDAREAIESVGECCPAYVSFEKESYTLSCEQIKTIARALYLADCELDEFINKKI